MQQSVIWLDSAMNSQENEYYQKVILEKYDDICYSFVSNEEEAMKAVYQSDKSILIVSGREGSVLIPKLRGGL